MIYSHPPPPCARPLTTMQIIPALRGVRVLPGIPGRVEELREAEERVRCVSQCWPYALTDSRVRIVARSGAHLKCIKPQERTILCNLAVLALLSGFLFAVRATPLHVAAASPSDWLFLSPQLKIFSQRWRARPERRTESESYRELIFYCKNLVNTPFYAFFSLSV